MRIIALTPDNERAVRQAAELLVRCFAHIPSGWHTLEEALAEVRGSFGTDRVSRIAVAENERGGVWSCIATLDDTRKLRWVVRSRVRRQNPCVRTERSWLYFWCEDSHFHARWPL